MARRRLTKVDGAGMSNRSRIACNPTFKSKRRHAIPAAKPLGKPPRFVVARSANPICRHIWNSICGIAAMLTNRVFAHKSPGTPYNCRFQVCHCAFRAHMIQSKMFTDITGAQAHSCEDGIIVSQEPPTAC